MATPRTATQACVLLQSFTSEQLDVLRDAYVNWPEFGPFLEQQGWSAKQQRQRDREQKPQTCKRQCIGTTTEDPACTLFAFMKTCPHEQLSALLGNACANFPDFVSSTLSVAKQNQWIIESHSPWQRMPRQVGLLVFAFLDTLSMLQSVECTCRSWRCLSAREKVWFSVDTRATGPNHDMFTLRPRIQNVQIANMAINELVSFGGKMITNLTVRPSTDGMNDLRGELHEAIKTAVKALPALSSLDIRQIFLSDVDFGGMWSSLSHLKRLALRAHWTNINLPPSLTSLHLECRFLHNRETFENVLQSLNGLQLLQSLTLDTDELHGTTVHHLDIIESLSFVQSLTIKELKLKTLVLAVNERLRNYMRAYYPRAFAIDMEQSIPVINKATRWHWPMLAAVPELDITIGSSNTAATQLLVSALTNITAIEVETAEIEQITSLRRLHTFRSSYGQTMTTQHLRQLSATLSALDLTCSDPNGFHQLTEPPNWDLSDFKKLRSLRISASSPFDATKRTCSWDWRSLLRDLSKLPNFSKLELNMAAGRYDSSWPSAMKVLRKFMADANSRVEFISRHIIK